MSYQVTGKMPGDEAFRVARDLAFEMTYRRDHHDDPNWGGHPFSGPMFSIKDDVAGHQPAYTFEGSDMDADPLIR